jgi:hypothetical protein
LITLSNVCSGVESEPIDNKQFDFLAGHASYTMTGRFGVMPQGTLRERQEMVEKVRCPGLDLSQLYR